MDLGERNTAWGRSLDASARAEWVSLQRESDPEIFYEDALAFAARQQAAGRIEVAAGLYGDILQNAASFAHLQNRARRSLDAILGRGEVGVRAELLLRRFAHEASDPSMLFAMAAAGAAFRLTRLATLSRLAASPCVNALTRGFGARVVSGLAGFALEAPTFTFASRFSAEALGREQDWRLSALGRDVASSYLVLGGLKLTGWGSVSLSRGLLGQTSTMGSRLLQGLFQQGGMLSGILLGHRMEEALGLRNSVAGATTFVDSLATLLQFNVAGRLLRQAAGPRIAAWEEGLDRRIQLLENSAARPQIIFPDSGGPQPAFAGASGSRSIWESTATSRPIHSGVFAMTMEGGGSGPGIVAKSHPIAGRLEETVPQQYRLEYPPEIDAMLREVEATMRHPDYYTGDRETLKAKRPPMEVIDRLWFYQAQDLLGRVDFVRTRMANYELLLEPLSERSRPPDADLIRRAVVALQAEGVDPSSPAFQVLEVRFPRKRLADFFGDTEHHAERSLSTLSSFREAQIRFEDRLHLAELESEEFVGRIISVSLWEKIMQSAFGEERTQVHPIDGAIARDHVMSLRSRRVFPMGFSRHQLVLGDLGEWVFPFAFGVHDGFFHGPIDAASRPGLLELAGSSYDWIRRRLPSDDFHESLLDRLSDSELGISNDLFSGGVSEHLRQLWQQSAEEVGSLPPSEERDTRRSEIHALAAQMARLMRESLADGSGPADGVNKLAEWEGFVDSLRDEGESSVTSLISPVVTVSSSQRISEAPVFVYPPEIESILGRLEASFSDPNYFEGSRQELLARRPSWDDIDALWHYQGVDYARRIPGASYDYVDAEQISTLEPTFDVMADPSLIARALARMGERAEAGHPGRQVLRIKIPLEFLQSEVYSPTQKANRYLSVLPPLLEVETYMQRRIGLMASAEDGVYYHFPSLSLFQALYQEIPGGASVELFPVPGEISRDRTMRLRSLRMPPAGFTRDLIYLGDAEVDVHPFSFIGHDVVFHAGRDATLRDPLPELSGEFYRGLKSRLPPHPVSEKIINALSDLEFESRSTASASQQIQALLLRQLNSYLEDASRSRGGAEKMAAMRELLPIAQAIRDFSIAEYRRFPALQGRERFLIAALQPYLRVP